MEEKICSFFGHREIDLNDGLYTASYTEIIKAINTGHFTFYFGGFGAFDTLCHNIVTKIKEERPELAIKRVYCVAEERHLRKHARYFNREDYDEIIYLEPSFEWWYKSIYYRNCAMIDKSSFIIFYAENRSDSGAYKAYKYAKKAKKQAYIVNLFRTE